MSNEVMMAIACLVACCLVRGSTCVATVWFTTVRALAHALPLARCPIHHVLCRFDYLRSIRRALDHRNLLRSTRLAHGRCSRLCCNRLHCGVRTTRLEGIANTVAVEGEGSPACPIRREVVAEVAMVLASSEVVEGRRMASEVRLRHHS